MPSMKNGKSISVDSPSALKSYWLATRPKTWVASISPVLMGAAMVPKLGISTLILTLLFALLIQIGTNYANDYYDYKSGADAHRKGPKRATSEGWIAPSDMARAFVLVFACALLVALPLMVQAGFWSFIVSGLCVAFGILYTGGPKPLGYLGLGELLVFPFFGPIAMCGTYYLQTGTLHLPVVIASLAPGALSTAILVANNLRDEETDRNAKKMTLVARFGHQFGLIEYYALLAIAAGVALFLGEKFCVWPLLLAYGPISLPKTALIQILYTALFCLSVW